MDSECAGAAIISAAQEDGELCVASNAWCGRNAAEDERGAYITPWVGMRRRASALRMF